MKFTILVGALALAATAFTPLAHASAALGGLDKQCYNTLRKEWSGCNKGAGSNTKFPDFKFNMKSHDKPNDKNNNGGDAVSNDPGTGGEDPGTNDVDNGGDDGDHNGGGNSNNNNGHGNDEDGNDDSNPGNSNDAGTDNTDTGASNNSPPQSNSNDIKGFDPSSGLYGPGT